VATVHNSLKPFHKVCFDKSHVQKKKGKTMRKKKMEIYDYIIHITMLNLMANCNSISLIKFGVTSAVDHKHVVHYS